MADRPAINETAEDKGQGQARVAQREETFSREAVSGGSPLEQMILALSDEIDFAGNNARKQTLKNGERNGEMGGLHLYAFPLERIFDFEADEDVAVAIGGRDYRGRVIKVDLASVVIGIEDHQGEILARVDVTKAEDVIEKLLRKQLVAVFDGNAGFHKRQAEHAIGLGEPETNASPIPDLVDSFLSAPQNAFQLNPQQNAFIAKALTSELSLLWGPPGCGKTMCIGLLAACLLDQGKRLLLASNTNKAVDGALEQALNTQQVIGAQTGDQSIVRFGGVGITEEFKSKWPAHLFENILHQRGEILEAEKAGLSAEQSTQSTKLAHCEQGLTAHEEHRRTEQRLNSLPNDIRRKEDAVGNLHEQLSQLEQRRRDLEAEWAEAPESPTLMSRLTGKRPREQVEADRTRCQDQRKTAQAELDEQTQRLAGLHHERKQLKHWLTELTERLEELPPEADLRAEQHILRSRLSEIDTRLQEIKKALGDLGRNILSEARLVGTTVHKTFLDSVLSSLDFDVVMVDEASMVVLPMIYWAAGRAKAQVVVVGDFRQLPAIVKNGDGKLVQDWAACSPFDKWHVRDAVREGRAKDLQFLVALQEQNRMHPEIGQLVSDLFYFDIHTTDGKGLLPGTRAKSLALQAERLPGQKSDKRIITIDTRELGGWSSQPFGGSGRFNPTHVALGLALIDRLALAGVLKYGRRDQIGFVTPYAGQAKLFAQAVRGRHDALIDETSIGTAHRFQGGERDIMIFDYVLSENRRYPNRFIDSETGEDQPANLLNVALSRAKKHLIVIYNSDDFGERSTHPWMRRFFTTLRERSEPLDAQELLQESDILGQVRELAHGHTFTVADANTIHDETTFYGAIRQDLATAQQAVTIFSAFATPENVSRWADLFQSMLKRGVRIRIVTKPVNNQPNAQRNGEQLKSMFHTLRRAGIVLDTRSATHEKVVIVDETIVWHGSLNMLSQNAGRTTELMTRTISPDYARELLHMLARHDLKQKDLTLPQMPVCPTCGGPTTLATNWKGQHFLFCEQDCGFVAGAWDFHRLVRGIPIGMHLRPCPDCGTGQVTVAQTKRGNTYGRCTNDRRKNGPKCNHKEDLRLGDLPNYEPYPDPEPPQPSILSDLADQVVDPIAVPQSNGPPKLKHDTAPPRDQRTKGAAFPKERQTGKATEQSKQLTASSNTKARKSRPPISRLHPNKSKKSGRSRPKDENELDAFLSSIN